MAAGSIGARRYTPVVLALTLCACGTASSDHAQNPRRSPDVESWELATTPSFHVPGFEIGGDSILFGVLGAIGTFTPRGEIVIAVPEGDHRIVFVDSLGTGIQALGGAGQGPGEFRRITDVTLKADTVAFWDWINNRAILFADGRYTGQIRLGLPRTQTVVGLLEDGTVVVTSEPRRVNAVSADMFPEDAIPAGQARRYHLLDRSGARVGTLLGSREPPPPVLPLTVVGQPRPTIMMDFSSGCWPTTLHVTSGDRLLVADSEQGRLYSIDRTGVLTPLYASPHRDTVRQAYVDLRERHIEAWEERSGTLTAASKEAVRERVGPAGDPFPTVWTEIVLDLQGDVWLQRSTCYADWLSDPTTTWEVVGEDGTLKATVTVPRNVSILSVDGERVLASVTDQLEVQYLALYRVRR